MSSLTLCGRQSKIFEKFAYLLSCISADVSDEINLRVVQARPAYVSLGYLRHLRDVSLVVKC